MKNEKKLYGRIELNEQPSPDQQKQAQKPAKSRSKKTAETVKKAAKNTAKIIAARAESESPEDSEPEGGIDPEA